MSSGPGWAVPKPQVASSNLAGIIEEKARSWSARPRRWRNAGGVGTGGTDGLPGLRRFRVAARKVHAAAGRSGDGPGWPSATDRRTAQEVCVMSFEGEACLRNGRRR